MKNVKRELIISLEDFNNYFHKRKVISKEEYKRFLSYKKLGRRKVKKIKNAVGIYLLIFLQL